MNQVITAQQVRDLMPSENSLDLIMKIIIDAAKEDQSRVTLQLTNDNVRELESRGFIVRHTNDYCHDYTIYW